MKTKITSLIAAGILGTALASQGAVITWGAATAVSTGSDISTTGTLVEAINLNDGDPGSVTANGVIFTNDGTLLGSSNGGDFYSGTTGDAGYDQILSDWDFGNGGGNTTLSLGGGNLVDGNDYEIQVWWSYNSDFPFDYGDGNDNNIRLESGEYTIGTFTADATTQDLELLPSLGSWGNSGLNAYQIRSVVPEPSSFALIGGLLALGHVMVRRRR